MPGPREPWPTGDGKDHSDQEILGPDDPGPGGRGADGGWGPGGDGPWRRGGARIRVLSGKDIKRFGTLGCIAALAIATYMLVLLFAAVIGLNDWLGILGAVGGFLLAILLRTSIPIIIGAFLCAHNVWDWGWLGSAIFAAPLLVLAIPFLSFRLLRMWIARRGR